MTTDDVISIIAIVACLVAVAACVLAHYSRVRCERNPRGRSPDRIFHVVDKDAALHFLQYLVRTVEGALARVPYLLDQFLGASLLSAFEATSSLPAGKFTPCR
jgi:hypothetical protein